MFLVVPDPAHGLVAAPRCPDDLTPDTVAMLTGEGFVWNGEIEAYARPTGDGPEAVERTAGALRALGHFVYSSYTPLPARRGPHHGEAGPHTPLVRPVAAEGVPPCPDAEPSRP
ncbi:MULTISPECIES: hypothetical protein [unclassified Streptomyces]|uniref:Uncharacterized protein n=1 Tax=Streptomyces sp. NBC_00060 TaxID=2975636 RepID=A0AAU2HEA4_9ACTN